MHIMETAEVKTAELNTGSNPGIAQLLAFGSVLEIEPNFGIQQYFRYLDDLALLNAGVPFAELGIAKRRAESQPAVFMPHNGSFELVTDRGLLKNERLTVPGSVALIRLNGVMTANDQLSTRGIQSVAGDFRAAYGNKNIAAVIMEINSGGGEGIAKDMLVSTLSERNKPVLSFGHFAASAAYGAAAATDEIIAASAESMFGSIGAVITLDNEVLQEFKQRYLSFYGKNAPNKSREFRAAVDGDFEPIQIAANKYTDAFQSEVANLRALRGDKSFQRETLSGDIFNAKESRQRGLIDGVGNLTYVLTRTEVWVKKFAKQNL